MKSLIQSAFNCFRGWLHRQRSSKSAEAAPSTQLPLTLSRAEHPISRKSFSSSALKVLYRLHHAGHQSYLVGGALRDLLNHQKPKDFDVVTDATPTVIRALFPNARIIGRRFQLVHILFHHEVVEVSTFRKDGAGEPLSSHPARGGRWAQNNAFGRIEDDELRRDFTVNALYYSIADFSLRDGVGALQDFERRSIRTIGSPDVRIKEDPARILRAIRTAAKLGFNLEPQLQKAIQALKPSILKLAPERLKEEILKIFQEPAGAKVACLMEEYGLWEVCFPKIWAQGFDLAAFERLFAAKVQDRFSPLEKLSPEARWMEGVLSLATVLWLPMLRHLKLGDPSEKPQPRGLEARFESLKQQLALQSQEGLSLTPAFQQALLALWQMQWKGLNPHLKKVAEQSPTGLPYYAWAYRLATARAQILNNTAFQDFLDRRPPASPCNSVLSTELIPPRNSRKRPRNRRKGAGAQSSGNRVVPVENTSSEL